MLAVSFSRLVVVPTIREYFPTQSPTQAQVLLIAIAGQETAWEARTQLYGPARGFFQAEFGGHVARVFDHASGRMKDICQELVVPFSRSDVYQTIAWNDVLACAIARIALLLDREPLPQLGEIDEAWAYYLRVWAPGKPDRSRWGTVYPLALNAAGHTPIGELGASS